jgi:hypothetical protein
MVQRTTSSACEEEEGGCAEEGDEVEGKEENKFGNLAEGEGAVDCGLGGLAQLFYGVGGFGKKESTRGDQVG